MNRPSLRFTAAFGISALLTVSAVSDDQSQALFNGKDLKGWRGVGGPLDNWKVADGILSCAGEPGSRWIATEKTFGDFELQLEFKVSSGGNSGVFIRMPLEGRPATDGMEIQIADDYAPRYVKKGVEKHTGALYGIEPPAKLATKKAGQWQQMRIVCVGRRVRVSLNGHEVIDVDLDAYPEKSKQRPGMRRKNGHIGLQNHNTPIEFRNIRIRTVAR